MGELIEWMGGPANAQALAAVFSAVTAAVAICIALWNGYITRQNARFSVEPALAIWADYPSAPSRCCTIYLANKGFGPAVVLSFRMFNDGRPIEGMLFEKTRNAIKTAFGSEVETISEVSGLDNGHAFGANNQIVIARFRVSEALTVLGTDGMSKRMRPLSLVIRYRDIYHRKWVFATYQFGGYTFRDVKWQPAYRRARKILGPIIDAPC